VGVREAIKGRMKEAWGGRRKHVSLNDLNRVT
jgi:hypothetical protein